MNNAPFAGYDDEDWGTGPQGSDKGKSKPIISDDFEQLEEGFNQGRKARPKMTKEQIEEAQAEMDKLDEAFGEEENNDHPIRQARQEARQELLPVIRMLLLITGRCHGEDTLGGLIKCSIFDDETDLVELARDLGDWKTWRNETR